MLEDRDDVVGAERLEDVDLRAREQRGVDLERRVLGGRADEHDRAALDVRQERVLLRLVEAVDLVDEQDGPSAGLTPAMVGGGDDVLDFANAGRDGAERDEVRPRDRREQAGHGGLAGARRAPEDQRMEQSLFEGAPQRLAWPDEMRLADELVERARPNPLGQGRAGRRRLRIAKQRRRHRPCPAASAGTNRVEPRGAGDAPPTARARP